METQFKLVHPQEVASLLAPKSDPQPVLLEAHFTSPDHPLDPVANPSRHLPGAIQIHPSFLEAANDQSKYYPNYSKPEDGDLMSHARLVASLHSLGITQNTPAIVYGSPPDATLSAARLAWGLLVAGVSSVHMLDGGIDAWVNRGGDTVSEIQLPGENPDTLKMDSKNGLTKPRPEWVATIDQVERASSNPGNTNGKLIDVRNPGEFSGSLRNYYPFYSEAGHIPGAILQGNWCNLVESKTGKLRPMLEEVRSRWIDLGIIDRDVECGRTELIFYCGTGWRSSVSFLIASLLGYRAKNYDGGFYEWSWGGERPVEILG